MIGVMVTRALLWPFRATVLQVFLMINSFIGKELAVDVQVELFVFIAKFEMELLTGWVSLGDLAQ